MTNESLSGTKRDPRKYKWYVYTGRKAELHTDIVDIDLTITKGETFGLKKARGSFFLLDGSERETQFKLKSIDANRLLNNSKPLINGKIGRYKVEPGEVPSDDNTVDKDGFKKVHVDSSFIRSAKYNSKTKRLKMTFANGNEIEYWDITGSQVRKFENSKSQGSYFNVVFKRGKFGTRVHKE